MVLLEKAARARAELSRGQVELVVTTGRGGRLRSHPGTSEYIRVLVSLQRACNAPLQRS
jgi:hypothetical protein